MFHIHSLDWIHFLLNKHWNISNDTKYFGQKQGNGKNRSEWLYNSLLWQFLGSQSMSSEQIEIVYSPIYSVNRHDIFHNYSKNLLIRPLANILQESESTSDWQYVAFLRMRFTDEGDNGGRTVWVSVSQLVVSDAAFSKQIHRIRPAWD